MDKDKMIHPCWYCKGKDLKIWYDSLGHYNIKCKACGTVLTGSDYGKTIAKWNEKYDRAYDL